MKRSILLGMAVLGALIAGGCAGPAVSVVGDVAGAAADKTVDLLTLGKAQSFQACSLEQAKAATRSAAEALSLKLIKQQDHPDQTKLTYMDDRKQTIVVTLVRRTPALTELHVDVGLFGVGGLSPMLIGQIVTRLPKNPQAGARADADSHAGERD